MRFLGSILLILHTCQFDHVEVLLQLCLPLDTCDEDELWLSGYVVGTGLLGLAGQANLLALLITVLLDVLLGALENDLAFLLVGLFYGSAADHGIKVSNA